MSKPHNPLLIITMDGAQETWLWDWMKKGYLPTLSKLIEEGKYGTIKSPEQYMEYGTELSLFSGKSRAEHGYYHYRELKKGTYKLQGSNPHLAEALPFWADLPSTCKVAVLDMVELPIVKNRGGIQLSNWVAHQSIIPPLPPISKPEGLAKEVAQFYGKRDVTSEYKADATFEQDVNSYKTFLRQIKRKGEMIRHLLGKDDFDLIVTSFYEVHRAGHRLWKYNADDYTQKDQMQNCFLDLYKAIDTEMAVILDVLPKNVNVFFISPFEMKSQYPTGGLMEEFCLKLGYKHTVSDEGTESSFSFNPLQIARKIIPESIRIKIGEKLGSKAQERLLSAGLEQGTDWSRTKLFAYPTVYTGLLRVNLKNREPQGIVETEKEYAALLQEVKTHLMKLIDPDTGEPAVDYITCPYELYGHIPEKLPDFFVEWKAKPTFLKKVIHPKTDIIQRKPAYFRSSWHQFKGFWAAKGPDIETADGYHDKGLLDFVPYFKQLLQQ